MKLKIAICDDEMDACMHIKELLKSYEMAYDFEFDISIFEDGKSLLNSYEKPGKYDVVFLDVEMPSMSGLLAAKKIRELSDYEVKIIFTSNYPEYMQDSFNVSAFQYLQKPITKEQLHMQFSRLIEEIRKKGTASILVKQDSEEEVLPIHQLLYVEAVKNKKNQIYYVCDEKRIIGKGNIGELEMTLRKHQFLSPFRGVIVNIQKVHYIRKKEIEMVNGDKIPLSRRKEKEFREAFSQALLG